MPRVISKVEYGSKRYLMSLFTIIYILEAESMVPFLCLKYYEATLGLKKQELLTY